MENITIEQIIAFFGVVMAIGGGLKYLLTPVIKYNEQQKDIFAKVRNHDEKLDNDNIRLNMLENDTKQILLSVNALLSHSINGNDTTKLKERKEELDKYLIQR
jgi:hypothetical protein